MRTRSNHSQSHANDRKRLRTLFGLATGIACWTFPNVVDAHALPAAAIQLHPGQVMGKVMFHEGDTASGGRGQHVDGIQADVGANVVYHVHAHLSLFLNGTQVAVPQEIGILHVSLKDSQGQLEPITAYYWLHTHDRSGIIHVESPEPPYMIDFTLGDFFDIWGEPLNGSHALGWMGPPIVYLNGKEYHGNPRQIPLTTHAEITLEVGKPLVTPPVYRFPSGY